MQVDDKVLLEKLYTIFMKIIECGDKMTSSTKFIDFFVHDMLDYTILA